MTGLLLSYPLEGHRNEAFAEYVLSSIATVVRVPRQVDFGFDLLCTLTSYYDKALYAGKSFGIQVKPYSGKTVTYGALHKRNGKYKWKEYEIDWLFKQDQPLFLGIVDLKNQALSLYSTHRMWWVYNEFGKPGKIILVPDVQPSGDIGTSWFKRTKLPTLDGGKVAGDGYSYKVPLGEPVVQIDIKQLENEDQQSRSEITESVKYAIELNNRNIMNCHGNIPITEDRNAWTGSEFKLQFFYHQMNDERKKSLLLSIGQAIVPLLQNYDCEAPEELDSMIDIAEFLIRHRCLRLEGILLLASHAPLRGCALSASNLSFSS